MEYRDYWDALNLNIYIEFKEKRILLYNTETREYLESSDSGTISLVSELYNLENLGIAFFDKKTSK